MLKPPVKPHKNAEPWSATKLYHHNDKVIFSGVVYVAEPLVQMTIILDHIHKKGPYKYNIGKQPPQPLYWRRNDNMD